MRAINKTMAILLLIGAILLNTCVCLAADDAVIFDAAIEHLRNYLDATEVESAKSGFHDIKSGYEKAPLFEAYANAIERGFIVNMDIIAGLPGEKLGIFKRTIKTLLELYPQNITIHTLSVKNGAKLKDNISLIDDSDVTKMVDYAEKTMLENGYKPYYLYRQKNQMCGLENVG